MYKCSIFLSLIFIICTSCQQRPVANRPLEPEELKTLPHEPIEKTHYNVKKNQTTTIKDSYSEIKKNLIKFDKIIESTEEIKEAELDNIFQYNTAEEKQYLVEKISKKIKNLSNSKKEEKKNKLFLLINIINSIKDKGLKEEINNTKTTYDNKEITIKDYIGIKVKKSIQEDTKSIWTSIKEWFKGNKQEKDESDEKINEELSKLEKNNIKASEIKEEIEEVENEEKIKSSIKESGSERSFGYSIKSFLTKTATKYALPIGIYYKILRLILAQKYYLSIYTTKTGYLTNKLSSIIKFAIPSYLSVGILGPFAFFFVINKMLNILTNYILDRLVTIEGELPKYIYVKENEKNDKEYVLYPYSASNLKSIEQRYLLGSWDKQENKTSILLDYNIKSSATPINKKRSWFSKLKKGTPVKIGNKKSNVYAFNNKKYDKNHYLIIKSMELIRAVVEMPDIVSQVINLFKYLRNVKDSKIDLPWSTKNISTKSIQYKKTTTNYDEYLKPPRELNEDEAKKFKKMILDSEQYAPDQLNKIFSNQYFIIESSGDGSCDMRLDFLRLILLNKDDLDSTIKIIKNKCNKFSKNDRRFAKKDCDLAIEILKRFKDLNFTQIIEKINQNHDLLIEKFYRNFLASVYYEKYQQSISSCARSMLSELKTDNQSFLINEKEIEKIKSIKYDEFENSENKKLILKLYGNYIEHILYKYERIPKANNKDYTIQKIDILFKKHLNTSNISNRNKGVVFFFSGEFQNFHMLHVELEKLEKLRTPKDWGFKFLNLQIIVLKKLKIYQVKKKDLNILPFHPDDYHVNILVSKEFWHNGNNSQ